MKFFIDTADVAQIKKYAHLVDGVTTNPSLIAKSGRSFKEVVKEICEIVDGPISAEVVSLDASGMVKEARELAKIHKNIVIKIPLTDEGIKATKMLSKEGIKTNVTLCFSANQALIAAKADATYVSPFIGRLDDIDNNGMNLIAEIKDIYANYGYKTEIIVASIRSPAQVKQSALIGADIATIPPEVLGQMIKHPLTDIGLQKFLADWEKVPKK
ncbi:MAG: fructose-6-phosphate aldolase [Nanoarchaeota archaeon]|nr:fructose-6-phosphate aldolase [Nanoarchaeota archaeon]